MCILCLCFSSNSFLFFTKTSGCGRLGEHGACPGQCLRDIFIIRVTVSRLAQDGLGRCLTYPVLLDKIPVPLKSVPKVGGRVI